MDSQQARFRELARRLRDGEIDAQEALELREKLDEVLKPEGGLWMFIRWGEKRMAKVYPALLMAPESGNAFALMTAAALSMDRSGQRTGVTMAALGRQLGLAPSQLSRAVSTLVELEVFVAPEVAGKSRTYELDARLVTRMDEPGRKAAAARQELLRRAARVKAEGEAEAGKRVASVRVVSGEDGPIADDRQPALV